MRSLREKIAALPNSPGVYLFKDRSGTVIYVGKAKALRRRVASYFNREPELKTSLLLRKIYDLDYQLTASEMDALLLEDQLVKRLKPRYNIDLKDDKAYPFLKLTIKEEWPRFLLSRRKENDGAIYFGPYTGNMAKEIVRLVKKLYPLRWCKASPLKPKEQPCLYYRIGVCSGPCIGKIGRQDYLQIVKGVKLLLRGDLKKVKAGIEEEMRRASSEQDYEKAAAARDRLQFVESLAERREHPLSAEQEGPKALIKLRDALDLPTLPSRIEAFDISNTQGTHIVASMVVFVDGAPFKEHYRRFKIRSVQGKPNDVQSINEVVSRRYGGGLATQLPLPDLILIDGGIPQLNSAQAAVKFTKAVDIPMIGLAKREEELFIPGRAEPIVLGRESAALQLLQRVRDEAHRFAVTFHRLKRRKGLFR